MKYGIAGILSVLMFCLCGFLGTAACASDAAGLMPVEKGRVFEYSCRAEGQSETFPMTITIAEADEKQFTVKIEAPFYQDGVRKETIETVSSGYRLLSVNEGGKDAMQFQPPISYLPSKIHSGQKWNWKGQTPWGKSESSSQVNGKETVAIDSRVYECTKITTNWLFEDGVTQEIVRWFAPGTGMVKEVITQSDGKGQSLTITALLMSVK